MNIIQSEAVSTFRDHYKAIFKQLERGPVLLLQNSKVAAVLVDPAQWNRQQEEIRRLRLLLEAKRTLEDIHSGKAKTTSHEELKRLMLEKRTQETAVHVGD